MGLDMYLSKRTYVKNWDFQPPEERHEFSITKNGEPVSYIKNSRISQIVEDVMYWRKSNQIHRWFVENVQEGQDDCREYYVSTEKLQSLIDDCNKVIEYLENSKKVKKEVVIGWENGEEIKEEIDVYDNTDVADELLPTTGGFFFGSTEYDEWYMKDLKNTVEVLSGVLQEDNSKASFYYSSSW